MGVGRRREGNSFRDGELNNPIAWIKLVHRFAPTGGRKLESEITRADQIKRFIDNRIDFSVRSMAVDFNQVEMGQTIEQPGDGDLADTPKIIGIQVVDVVSAEVRRAGRNGAEHLVGAIEETRR